MTERLAETPLLAAKVDDHTLSGQCGGQLHRTVLVKMLVNVSNSAFPGAKGIGIRWFVEQIRG